MRGSTVRLRPEFRSRRAFTLIELLVVVSIIALLLTLLLPALNKAREQAKRVVCIDTVRGIGYAALIYSHEYKDCLPFWTSPTNDPTHAAQAWHIAAHNIIFHGGQSGGLGQLYPEYIDDGHAFYCPSSPVKYNSAQTYRLDPATSFADHQTNGSLSISSSYHFRGSIKPVVTGGKYDYYSLTRVAVKIPVKHPDWVITTDLGYQYEAGTRWPPLINHPDQAGHPQYFSLGWGDGHVSTYFVKNKDWTGFPDYCGVDFNGRDIYPLANHSAWTAIGMDRMQEDNW